MSRSKRSKPKTSKASSRRAGARRQRIARRRSFRREGVRTMLGSVFEDIHATRLDSISRYTTAIMRGVKASVSAIGAAYAEMEELKPKHGIKQFDRFLSNEGIDVAALTPGWARFVLGGRSNVLVALDWTEFDEDDHATICAYVVTTHGRATPLIWRTVKKSELKERRTGYEHALIERLHEAIPHNVGVDLLADRGFGDQVLYATLATLGWDYTIRFRGNILVEHDGKQRPAAEWLLPTGRARKLEGARVTDDRTEVGAVVVVHDKKMKEPWFLATSHRTKTASAVAKLYGRRFTIEETFRDQKDLRFGLGLRATHIRSAARRDRFLFLLAIAQALLTLLGAASERAGLDAYLRANTVKRRTHSLFRQGTYWYGCIPTMRDEWFDRLIAAYVDILQEHRDMFEIVGAI
jgi:hypothetical protein